MIPSRNRLRSSLLLLLPLAGLATATPPAIASEPATAPAPTAAATVAPTPPPAAGGMVVARDPETGALTLPTPEQRRELQPEQYGAALQSVQPLFEEAVPGGGYMIRLDGLLMDYALATRDADGKLHLSCVHGAAAAAAAAPAAAPGNVTPLPEVK